MCGMRQMLGNRHMSLQSYLQTTAPMTEVWEGHHRFLADSKHLPQQFSRVSDGLEGIGHDDHVEIVVGKVTNTGIQILFNDVYALTEAELNIGRISIKSVPVNRFLSLQGGEQISAAAAQIEDPRVRIDQVADQG